MAFSSFNDLIPSSYDEVQEDTVGAVTTYIFKYKSVEVGRITVDTTSGTNYSLS